jgi:nicotinamide-nucleotide amidase
MAGVDLVMEQSVLDHIKQMYVAREREMPLNNKVQAWFPRGSRIINNPEGTAPGIDFESDNKTGSHYRIFALPGVPVEMKQMWKETVEPELRRKVGNDFIIHHHTIHCFGSGESHIETMLPGLVERGRDPQVGITASAATISLRISTRGPTTGYCLEKMQPTIATIRESLGDLVFGENGMELHHVVVELLNDCNKTVAILDAGLNGAMASLIATSGDTSEVVAGSKTDWDPIADLSGAAADFAQSKGAHFGLAIGPIDRDPAIVKSGKSFYEVVISDGAEFRQEHFRFSGHSGWREDRATKEVLNFFRLHLLSSV